MTEQHWIVEHARGDAAAFHHRDLPTDLQPSIWWFDVERPALVLGSAQSIDQVDLDACRADGIDVVRRRSGGGAVLLESGDVTWVDVLIPTTHHRWTNDVSSSAWWLGEVWRRTLADLGVDGATVHVGPMVTTAWSSRVCFAGIGGGEVVTDRIGASGEVVTSKIVGISQRRSRAGARFQCALYRHWHPERHARLFVPASLDPAELADVTTTVAAEDTVLRGTFERHLEAAVALNSG